MYMNKKFIVIKYLSLFFSSRRTEISRENKKLQTWAILSHAFKLLKVNCVLIIWLNKFSTATLLQFPSSISMYISTLSALGGWPVGLAIKEPLQKTERRKGADSSVSARSGYHRMTGPLHWTSIQLLQNYSNYLHCFLLLNSINALFVP